MYPKTAMVTGVTGQDGSFLTELLLAKGYIVHGIVRPASIFNTSRLKAVYSDSHERGTRLFLHYGDVTDSSRLQSLLEAVHPDEVYNLAAQSHVRVSFDQAEYTADTIAMGTLRMLEALRTTASGKTIRFYQAGSAEMFGGAPPPQSEKTPFCPRSPYAASKVAAHWFAVNYREAYGLFICNGILFNHESERRGETFVTRKITRALTRIKLGIQKTLYLGDLDPRRDWGYAPDYAEAMWLMLQQDAPDDYVVATGESYSVRDFLDAAAEQLDLDWSPYVKIDPRHMRPTEVDVLLGDPSKARCALGWRPRVGFHDLVRIMVEHDLRLAEKERLLIDNGHMAVTAPEASYA
jgi:GDPmannose 4,6-dehydratase